MMERMAIDMLPRAELIKVNILTEPFVCHCIFGMFCLKIFSCS